MRDRSQLAGNSRSLCSGKPEAAPGSLGKQATQEHPRQSAEIKKAQRYHSHPENTQDSHWGAQRNWGKRKTNPPGRS